MSYPISLSLPSNYEIAVHGHLDATWIDWFGPADMRAEYAADDSPVTIISNVVLDQAGLVALIRRLHGHGFVLLSIRQVAPGSAVHRHG